MILIAIASVTVICMSFVKSAQITTNNIFTPMLEKFRRRFYKIQGGVSIFKGECFKHYKGSMAIIAIILFLSPTVMLLMIFRLYTVRLRKAHTARILISLRASLRRKKKIICGDSRIILTD